MFLVFVSSLLAPDVRWSANKQNKFVSVEIMKPRSLENFLNKVDESRRSPSSCLSQEKPQKLYFFYHHFDFCLPYYFRLYLLHDYQSIH